MHNRSIRWFIRCSLFIFHYSIMIILCAVLFLLGEHQLCLMSESLTYRSIDSTADLMRTRNNKRTEKCKHSIQLYRRHSPVVKVWQCLHVYCQMLLWGLFLLQLKLLIPTTLYTMKTLSDETKLTFAGLVGLQLMITSFTHLLSLLRRVCWDLEHTMSFSVLEKYYYFQNAFTMYIHCNAVRARWKIVESLMLDQSVNQWCSTSMINTLQRSKVKNTKLAL